MHRYSARVVRGAAVLVATAISVSGSGGAGVGSEDSLLCKKGSSGGKRDAHRRACMAAYEDRRKLTSLPEIFSAHASVAKSGVQYMTRGDFLRSTFAYHFTTVDGKEVKRRCGKYSNELLGSGPSHLISESEFAFLVALLNIPLQHAGVAFDAVASKLSDSTTVTLGVSIDREQFLSLMARLLPDGTDLSELEGTALMRKWFPNSESRINRQQLESFLRNLLHDVHAAELHLYSRTIPATERSKNWWGWWMGNWGVDLEDEVTVSLGDLALTLVSSMDPYKLPDALSLIDNLKGRGKQIPFGEALELHMTLSEHTNDICDALSLYCDTNHSSISPAVFARAVNSVQEANQRSSIDLQLLHLAFYMFDTSGDGFLSLGEVEHVLASIKARRLSSVNSSEGKSKWVWMKRLATCVTASES